MKQLFLYFIVIIHSLILIASGYADNKEFKIKIKAETALTQLICEENMLAEMDELLKYLDFLSRVRLSKEGSREAQQEIDQFWKKIEPYLQEGFRRHGMVSEDLRRFLADRESLWDFSRAVTNRAIQKCPTIVFPEKERIASAINAIGCRFAVK